MTDLSLDEKLKRFEQRQEAAAERAASAPPPQAIPQPEAPQAPPQQIPLSEAVLQATRSVRLAEEALMLARSERLPAEEIEYAKETLLSLLIRCWPVVEAGALEYVELIDRAKAKQSASAGPTLVKP